MFAIFITSLILLAALLVLKMLELKAGKRFFLASLRDQADEIIQSGYRSVTSQRARLINHLSRATRRHFTSCRYRVSDWLQSLSERIRK